LIRVMSGSAHQFCQSRKITRPAQDMSVQFKAHFCFGIITFNSSCNLG
jgi:hypothetical protein